MRKDFQSLLFVFVLLLIGTTGKLYSQDSRKTIVKGRVTDAKTGEPLAFVTVMLENTTVGANTDDKGNYTITTNATSYKAVFRYLGYASEFRMITPGTVNFVNIALKSSEFELGEVIVKPQKREYSNRNNPAVDLIEKVISNKKFNRKEAFSYYTYDKYEKLLFLLNDIPEKVKSNPAFRDIRFIFNNTDTAIQKGKVNLPFFITENSSTFYYRDKPEATKRIINGEKTINFSEYLDNDGITGYTAYLYQNIDIYQNTIFFLSNKFLSPVGSGAPAFYRYYILDTTEVSDTRCIKMFFEPRNAADFLFHGFLYVTSDSSHAIRKIDMSFNKGINIDWVTDVRIVQDFTKVGDKAWMLSRDEVTVEFGIVKGLPGFVGKRLVSYNNITVDEPVDDGIFAGLPVERREDYDKRDRYYWDSARIPPLSTPEELIYRNVDSVKKIRSFRRDMTLVMLATTEFVEMKKFEIGPVSAFYSFNYLEGSRVRFGGRTTTGFSNRIYFEPYIAYGFKDRRFKYNLTTTLSLNGKSIYTFPVSSISLTYNRDISIPGQELYFSTPDNLLLSFKRGVSDKFFYNETLRAEYLHEYENHFSQRFGFRFTRQAPGGNLFYYRADDETMLHAVNFIDISEAYLNLRYAPMEKFYQGKIYRDLVPSNKPVFSMRYTIGSKAIGNDYNYQKLQFSVSKRFYESIIGYTDVAFETGKIFGKVPLPLLYIHNANQTFAYGRYSYNMMNFLEFVSDEYASLNIDHSFNGFFFNKIPLLKKLKLREVLTCKVLYGGLTSQNDPEVNGDLFSFPVNSTGTPLTYTLDKKPYVEVSAGFSNILRIFRIDVIKRLTYTNNPGISTIGIRFQVRLDI
ncbi:MAG: DUF5686 family protein [Bacteroidales bacterium]